SSFTRTSASNLPWTESYLRRWASVAGESRSLMATISTSSTLRSRTARRTLLPIRPKPLMANFIAPLPFLVELAFRQRSRGALGGAYRFQDLRGQARPSPAPLGCERAFAPRGSDGPEVRKSSRTPPVPRPEIPV